MIELILAITLIVSVSTTVFFISKYLTFFDINNQLKEDIKSYKDKYNDLRKSIDEERTTRILIGDRGLYECSLNANAGKESYEEFSVLYEVDIVDESKNKLKVTAYNYTTISGKYPNDPTRRQSIIDFFKDQWVNKNAVDIIVDESSIINSKINRIII